MKKNYTFLSVLMLACSLGFAQNRLSPQVLQAEQQSRPVKDQLKFYPQQTKKGSRSKAIGDTLFYEDFDGGLNGWTALNNNSQNNNIWQWDTVYQAGGSTPSITAIKSTTGANGFLSLPADLYNSPPPPGGAFEMDTYVESPVINIGTNNSVYVSYQQYLAYCCSGADRLVLQVSTDNFITSTEFDASDDLPVNVLNTSNAVGGATNVINISCALNGSPTFKMRFYAEGIRYYFWMIDDIAVIEGAENDLELQDPYMEFNETNYTYYPFYGQIPYHLFPPLPFFGRVKNNGGNSVTNAEMIVSVDHLAFPSGGGGVGNLHSTSGLVGPTGDILGAHLLPCDSLTPVLTPNPRFVPFVTGDFQVNWLLTSDSADENLGNETATQFFSISDTVYARDDGTFGGGTGPGNYVSSTGQPGGTTVGDRFATMYIIEKSPRINQAMTIPTSITYRVSGDPANIGVEITPKIWEFHDSSLFVAGSFNVNNAIGPEVAGSFFPYTITAADTNTFLTLPLYTGSAIVNGFDSLSYLVGWEVTNLPSGTNFEVLNDPSSAALQSPVTSFVYLGHAPSEGWGWVRDNPGIRLNMGMLPPPLFTSIENPAYSDVQLAVSPNPNRGEFKLNVSTNSGTTFNLNVRNMIGQIVYTDVINVKDQFSKQMDLSSFEKGVYFVSLENENEKLMEKVIIQ